MADKFFLEASEVVALFFAYDFFSKSAEKHYDAVIQEFVDHGWAKSGVEELLGSLSTAGIKLMNAMEIIMKESEGAENAE